MTIAEQVGRLVIDLVPQWYTRPDGFGANNLVIGEMTIQFDSPRALTPNLRALRARVEEEAPEWVLWLERAELPGALALVQEAFALAWLEINRPDVDWRKVLTYTNALAGRTYENQGIVCNLIVSAGTGSLDMSESQWQKYIDPLASSPHSFLRVTPGLHLVSYEAIPWAGITDSDEYKLYPEFLHPFHSAMAEGELSIHHTARGDLLILERAGLLAARRKGAWRLYDSSTLKNSMGDVLGGYWVGCNLFEFLLDVSFRRHGALLVYDRESVTLDRIVNPASIVAPGRSTADPIRAALASAVADVRLGRKNGLVTKKRLLIELASMDGAIVFDDDRILAIGAMIATHPDVGSHAGARTTAARSAQAYGARPVKVSADGDIDVFFHRTVDGVRVPLALSFL